ncbi:MAG: D-tyrosyl-tRNA(Tyr) deacylase [Clostridia bacterium]|nr:D-tyrosyl-tRNA(Tyr) deacylase [Clostridia bacterium]
MRCVVQRVSQASVVSEGQLTGQIEKGLMVLVGVKDGDTDKDVKYMADKVPNLRIFEDEQDKMNLSVKDVGGAILAVSQFTLYGDARGGRRPSFIAAARPDEANALYEKLVEAWRAQGLRVETGVFRTHMAVSLTNDGPVTLLLDSEKNF